MSHARSSIHLVLLPGSRHVRAKQLLPGGLGWCSLESPMQDQQWEITLGATFVSNTDFRCFLSVRLAEAQAILPGHSLVAATRFGPDAALPNSSPNNGNCCRFGPEPGSSVAVPVFADNVKEILAAHARCSSAALVRLACRGIGTDCCPGPFPVHSDSHVAQLAMDTNVSTYRQGSILAI